MSQNFVIVVVGNKLVLKAASKPLINASFDAVYGEKHVYAHGEATRHREFAAFCKSLGQVQKVEVEKAPEWCHYHKANVGHSIDHCPDVRCRTCRASGHTDRVCEAKPCEACNKYGHVLEACFSRMTCEKCGVTGHPTEKCFGPREAPQKTLWCSYHKVEGEHSTSRCPDLQDWECENCGEKGHFFKNCRNPHIVRNPFEKVSTDVREFIYSNDGARPLKPKK